MGTRDIVDSLGNVIGEMTLPEDTTEEQWTEALSVYSKSIQQTQEEALNKIIDNAITFGTCLIREATREHIAMGITDAGKTKVVADYCANIQMYLNTGSLYATLDEIDLKLASPIPEEVQPFITEARLNDYKTKIKTYLGIE